MYLFAKITQYYLFDKTVYKTIIHARIHSIKMFTFTFLFFVKTYVSSRDSNDLKLNSPPSEACKILSANC